MAKAQPIGGLDVEASIFSNACLIIETRLGEMLNYEPFVHDVKCVFELHQMRIAAKRLRYSLEIFLPLYVEHTGYGREIGKAKDEVKALQEHLGEIHDRDVLVPRLEEHLSRLLKAGHGHDKHGALRTGVHLVDIDACQGVLTLCIEARNERVDRYARFLDDWTRLRDTNFFGGIVELLRRAAELSAGPVAAEATS
jgi:CHAD domain-containing protein